MPQHWLIGIENDFAFGDSSMTQGGIPGAYGNGEVTNFALVPGIYAQTQDSSSIAFGWDGSVRGRIGYLALPAVLVYGTGGAAFQQVSVGASCNPTAKLDFGLVPNSWCGSVADFNSSRAPLESPKSETASAVQVGRTVGGGVEAVVLGNWIGKLEFRYANLGQFNHNFFAGTDDEVDINVRVQTYTFLAGIGYKFNGIEQLLLR